MAEEPLSPAPDAPPLTVRRQPANYDAYLDRIAQIESSGDPTKVNASSGAAGLYQFMPTTWKQYGQGSPLDPVAARAAALRLTMANAAVLQRALGRAPTLAELYLAHQQGAGGAVLLLTHPDQPAGALVGDAAVRGNGGDPAAPASQFVQKWIAHYDNTKPAAVGSTGSVPDTGASLLPLTPLGDYTPSADDPAAKKAKEQTAAAAPAPAQGASLAPLVGQPMQPLVPRSTKEWYLDLLKQPTAGA